VYPADGRPARCPTPRSVAAGRIENARSRQDGSGARNRCGPSATGPAVGIVSGDREDTADAGCRRHVIVRAPVRRLLAQCEGVTATSAVGRVRSARLIVADAVLDPAAATDPIARPHGGRPRRIGEATGLLKAAGLDVYVHRRPPPPHRHRTSRCSQPRRAPSPAGRQRAGNRHGRRLGVNSPSATRVARQWGIPAVLRTSKASRTGTATATTAPARCCRRPPRPARPRPPRACLPARGRERVSSRHVTAIPAAVDNSRAGFAPARAAPPVAPV